MFDSKAEVPQKTSLEIKQDDKFFSRLLSKETSISHPSFRVSVAIPFVWESQPGTPKYTFSEKCTLPPLTPPPSYYTNTSNDTKKHIKKRSNSNLFRTLFPKLNHNKTFLSSSSSSSLSSASWSSSNSSKVVPAAKLGSGRFLSSSSFDFRGDYEEDDAGSLRSATSCFGIGRIASSNSGFRSWSRRRA